MKCYGLKINPKSFSFMYERILHNASLYYTLIDIEQNYTHSLETLLKTKWVV